MQDTVHGKFDVKMHTQQDQISHRCIMMSYLEAVRRCFGRLGAKSLRPGAFPASSHSTPVRVSTLALGSGAGLAPSRHVHFKQYISEIYSNAHKIWSSRVAAAAAPGPIAPAPHPLAPQPAPAPGQRTHGLAIKWPCLRKTQKSELPRIETP